MIFDKYIEAASYYKKTLINHTVLDYNDNGPLSLLASVKQRYHSDAPLSQFRRPLSSSTFVKKTLGYYYNVNNDSSTLLCMSSEDDSLSDIVKRKPHKDG